MYPEPYTFPDGKQYVPGICIFCDKPYAAEKSDYLYGHQKCAEDFERESDAKMRAELVARLPEGTRLDMAGGAACD